jgi:hypothetical protein
MQDSDSGFSHAKRSPLLGVKLAEELSKQLSDSQIQVFKICSRPAQLSMMATDFLKTDQEVTAFADDLGAGAGVVAKAERIQSDSCSASLFAS